MWGTATDLYPSSLPPPRGPGVRRLPSWLGGALRISIRGAPQAQPPRSSSRWLVYPSPRTGTLGRRSPPRGRAWSRKRGTSMRRIQAIAGGSGTRAGAAALACCIVTALAAAGPAAAVIRRVGTYNGVKGGYTTIQRAVEAARPGDWILVAPGDYKETGDHLASGSSPGEAGAGVLVEKS